MKFYEIDTALSEAIERADSPVRLRISLDWSNTGFFESVFEQDIIEASFTGLKETTGGTSARGEVLLDNTYGGYASGGNGGKGAGKEVRIGFSLGEGLSFFERFILYVDDQGFQDIRGPGRKRFLRLVLRDRTALLRKTDENRDWTAPAVFTYSVICDKTQPEKSLVHLIAKRAGIETSDIDCATIPITLPYIRLTKNVWEELSELAYTYRAHLECAPEKPLVFAHSPYQSETETIPDDEAYCFTGEAIFYLGVTARADLYRNTIRLKINIPVALERQEIWRYEDAPVLYDEDLIPRYPFRASMVREIEVAGYEARYFITEGNGQRRWVTFADEIDTKAQANSRIEHEGGSFEYAAYDTTTHRDRAIITLQHDQDGDVYRAAIYGRPIVHDLNRSCFLRDEAAITQHGTAALNVTGAYFSEDDVHGKRQYEDWTRRELAERLPERREYTVKTHRGLFNARIGADVQIETKAEKVTGTINSLTFRYRRDAAFVAVFRFLETGGTT
ncbi:hypothetical protein AGMMS49991_03950 [Spirochaetia bacterium]|nr:hypothetical protein AGMMS49991_03950 [Spirochaetia bacterium]